MIQAIRAFLEFSYLVRRSVLTDDDLLAISKVVAEFHTARIAFKEVRGIDVSGYSLPRQHSITHYVSLIREFGAPNGLCSSITESKHIKAVKEPWRRSSRFNALGQMLLTNQRLDKLSALRVELESRGLLQGLFFDQDDPRVLNLPEAHPSASATPAPGNSPTGIGAEDDDDCGGVDEQVLGDVKLSQKRGMSLIFMCYNTV